jgi:hypothetical protein
MMCGAADEASLGGDQARINPPILNSLLLLTLQWQQPAHQGFAGLFPRGETPLTEKKPAPVL